MSEDTKKKLEMLERSVLELGSELYTLKGTIAKNHESHEQFLAIIMGLKALLDEKGLITREDFDAAVELGAALEAFNAPFDLPGDGDKLKKGH